MFGDRRMKMGKWWQRVYGIAGYWWIIGGWLMGTAVLFLAHLFTGYMPDRVAWHIVALDLDLYWYGVWIVGGISLGAFVVAQLVQERGQAMLETAVPAEIRAMPLSLLPLPTEIQTILQRRHLDTVGDVLWRWGMGRGELGLNQAGLAKLDQTLRHLPQFQATWLDKPAWDVWYPDHVWNGLIYAMILAVIGARLYHVLTPSPSMAAQGIASPLDYWRRPDLLLNFRGGGLGIYGGLVGGALGLWAYTRRRGLPTLAWTDLTVIGLALGQVFGRWGNFFNQELYGRPTNLPWAITIDPIYRLPEYAQFARFHPAFLYESLWNLLAFGVLFGLYRRYASRWRLGDLTAVYLVFYAVGRILLELVRLDSRMIHLVGLDLPVASLISLGLVLLMATWRGWAYGRAGAISED